METLTESLDLLCQKKREGPFITRLEARFKLITSLKYSNSYLHCRFGKVTWGRFPEEVYSARYSIEELANLLFAKDVKYMNIFNTEYVALISLLSMYCLLY